jgi:phage baseplate assembly protein W
MSAAGVYSLKITNGDLVFDSMGRLETVTGEAKIIQDISVILQSVKGSYPFESSFGTDLVGINAAGRDKTLIKNKIKAALLTYPEIDTVDSIDVSIDEDRHLTIKVACTLVSGATISTTETIS